MIERKLFEEIPGGKNSFHSAVLTSYAFNFNHFEHQVLRTLRGKWVNSINVLVDSDMVDQALGFSSGNVFNLSESYAVIGVKSKAAFHPKLNFLFGDSKALFFWGSGNITPGGHGKNHELFSGLFANDKETSQLDLISEAWQYLLSLATRLEGYHRKRITRDVTNSCDLLSHQVSEKHQYVKLDEETELALVYHDNISILNQLKNLIPNDPIDEITVVSPFYDNNGVTLLKLLETFPNATMKVYLMPESGLPPLNMEPNPKIKFYSWDETKRGQVGLSGKSNFDRPLHSKIFHFKSQQYEYCLIGSANATIHAFGNNIKNGVNDEFGGLYKTSSSGMLSRLGVKGSKRKLKIKDFTVEEFPLTKTEESGQRSTHRHHLISVDLYGPKVTLYHDAIEAGKELFLILYNDLGMEVHCSEFIVSTDQKMTIDVRVSDFKGKPKYACLANNEKETISNKQLVNNISKLDRTNPTTSNRTINQLLTALEAGEVNEYNILEFCLSLTDHNDRDTVIQSKIGGAQGVKEKEDLSQLSYREAIELAQNAEYTTKIYESNYQVKLWEILPTILFGNKDDINEELADEEEEASSNQSATRIKSDQESNVVGTNKKESVIRLGKLKDLLSGYRQQLKKVTQFKKNKIVQNADLKPDVKVGFDRLDCSHFLIVSYVMSNLTLFTEYRFPLSKKDPLEAETLAVKYKHRLKTWFCDKMVDLLADLAKYRRVLNTNIDRNDISESEQLRKSFDQLTYHVFLYLYLIDRISVHEYLRQKNELIGLNLLHNLGLPNDEMQEYLETIAGSQVQKYFSPDSVLKYVETLQDILQDEQLIGEFGYVHHSGICRITSESGSKIGYNSIYGSGKISSNKFKRNITDIG